MPAKVWSELVKCDVQKFAEMNYSQLKFGPVDLDSV